MKHICEICSKQYATVAEAEKCELAHKKKNAEEAARVASEEAISDAVNAYITKYKTLPSVAVIPENQEFVIGEFGDKLETLFDKLLDIFREDDEE